ncbi:GDSL-type esterase/lipase family protein [Prolixibacteraceae bacterium]|nr:GDSL-type esterase/lipase family protein [Prolixibacteraceae bacterium]
MRASLITILFFALATMANAQFSSYYYQRKTLFELMPNDKNEIIFLGNSITNGCEWTEVFDDLKIKNRGISGDVTAGVIHRLSEVYESSPEKVFLLIGINDLFLGKTPDYVYKNILTIVRVIKDNSPKTEVFVQSLLPVNDFDGRHVKRERINHDVLWVNEQLKTNAAVDQYIYLDIHNKLVDENGNLKKDYSNDGVHLMGKGYLTWAELLKPYLD